MDRRQYLRHFMIILSGNSAPQVVNLLSYPFLGRIYSPAAFGVFAMFVAASGIGGWVACGRFDLAVTTAPNWGRSGILWLCIVVATAVGSVSAGIAALYWNFGGRHIGAALPLLLGLSVTLIGFTYAFSMFVMRHDRYRTQSTSILTRTICVTVVQIGLGLVAPTALSLIIGYVFGLAAQVLVLAGVTWLRISPRRARIRDMRAMFFYFRRQVMVDIPSSLIAALSANLLTILLAGLYDQKTVGYYAIGSRLAIAPLQVFNDALSQTFFQKAARAKENKGHFWDEMKLNLITSGLLSIGVLVAIVFLARPFVSIYLGRRWDTAADMLIILAPMLAVRSLTTSISTTVFVMRSAHWLFVHNIAAVLTSLLAYGIAVALRLSALNFLIIVSAFLTVEFALFGTFLVIKARWQRFAVLQSEGAQ